MPLKGRFQSVGASALRRERSYAKSCNRALRYERMNAVTLAALIVVVSLAFLIAPLTFQSSVPSGGSIRGARIVIQMLPVSLVAIYFYYAESHSRILIFSYERPHYSIVICAVATLQFFVTTALIWNHPLSQLRKLIWVCAAVFGAVAFSFIAGGVVSCMYGNCF